VRFQLRWKILPFTVLAPISLALGTLVLVNRSVSDHVQASIREDLERSSLVFENLLSERSRSLSVAGQVIVRDPRFFSVLTLPASWQDPQFRATVRGVARDFEAITRTDLFEVLDRKGHVLASVGRDASTPEARAWLVKAVPAGRTVSGILVERRDEVVRACPLRLTAERAQGEWWAGLFRA